MKIHVRKAVIFSFPVIILLTPVFVFYSRQPVLIVTDEAFFSLYGETRSRRELRLSSFILFRPVRAVVVADDAGDDIVQFAVAGRSIRPYCVLFPLRFARSARLYREGNPKIPVVILEGRYTDEYSPSFAVIEGNPSEYFIYKTDIDNDFYKAAMAAADLSMDKNGKTVVFTEVHFRENVSEAFALAARNMEKPFDALFYTSFSQFTDESDVSCVIIAGAGIEYFGSNSGVPVILFTWIEPSLVPSDAAVIVNDSPFAQAVQAARMVNAGITAGRIQSKFHIIKKNIDGKTLRKMPKSGNIYA